MVLMSVPEQIEDSVLHYLRADGREVRPGRASEALGTERAPRPSLDRARASRTSTKGPEGLAAPGGTASARFW